MSETKVPISNGKKARNPLQDLETQVKVAQRLEMSSLCGWTQPLFLNKQDLLDEDFVYIQDIRQQLADQLRCFETRTDVETAILSEIQDYFKRRADVELEYSRNLERLSKQISARHKAEKQKREAWGLFSLYSWWQQLIEDTKVKARNHAVLGDIYCSYVVPKLISQSDQLQRISKRCREIGSDSHQEILRVLTELYSAMKSYQLCHTASTSAETKFRAVETQKQRFEESHPNKVGNRKHRFVEKDFEKKQSKYIELQMKTLKSRNEYLLCVDAANAALHKYFADDVSDLIDCMDVGMDQWLSVILGTVLEAHRHLLDSERQQDNSTKNWLMNFDARADKRRYLESHHATFTLPRKFDYRLIGNRSDNHQYLDPFFEDELRQRHAQLECRLNELRIQNEEVWKTYATAEKKLMEIQRQPELKINDLFSAAAATQTTPMAPLQTTSSGSNLVSGALTVSSNVTGVLKNDPQSTSRPAKNSCREPETVLQKRKSDMCEMEGFLLQKFYQYLLTSNLIQRLEARSSHIQNALGISSTVHSTSMASFVNGARGGNDFQGIDAFLDSCHSLTSSFAVGDITGEANVANLASSSFGRLPSFPQKSKRKRVGRATEFFPVDASGQRPRLFGGCIEEYVEATGEDIPRIIRSCIRMLSTYGLHHQGLFRISGSQVEINAFKEAFERGEDPLADVTDASDANSVAGVLKLYFRELREPLFPMFMFDQFVDCTSSESKTEVIAKIKELLKTLPRPVYIVMRYLFGFLNHLSEFSDENMMDPYNLAICFGPTLLPIPESRDQVLYHNHVNELMKNMIVHHEEIFPSDDPLLSGGIIYEKYFFPNDVVENEAADQNEYENEASAQETARYETVAMLDEETMALTEAKRTGFLNNVEHSYEEVQPAIAVTTPSVMDLVSPSESNALFIKDTRRPCLDDLHLSNHGSLKASPESPDQPSPKTGHCRHFDQSAVWLRRQDPASVAIVQNDGGNIPRQASGQLTEAKNDGKIRSQNSIGTNAPKLKHGDGDSASLSSGSNKIPSEFTAHPIAPDSVSLEFPNAALQLRATSSSSSSYSDNYQNAIMNESRHKGQNLSRSYSKGFEQSKPHARRECLIGSLKRLSLNSYGVPAPGGALSSNSTPLTLAQEDLEFIQQTDFTSAADGLSPTSLKEIQVELKAVLNSLESFTVQQQKSRGKSNLEEQNALSNDTADGVDRPDLVQNLPSQTSATPTSPANNVMGNQTCVDSKGSWHAEVEDDTKKSDKSDSRGGIDPSVSNQAISAHALQSLSQAHHDESSSNESSSEGYTEDAML